MKRKEKKSTEENGRKGYDKIRWGKIEQGRK